jgi:hypothetical protein
MKIKNITMIRLNLFGLLLFFAIISCIAQDVYVVGFEANDKHLGVAKLWKNGVAQNLSDGSTHVEGISIYVSGNDVYIVGNERESMFVCPERGISTPKFWKNGIVQNLSDEAAYTTVTSLYVSDNNVYVTGTKRDTQSFVAKLWINEVLHNLSDSTEYAWAESVYVSNNDIYVAGTKNWTSLILWKNGIAQNFINRYYNGHIKSVYVHNDDVYIIGTESNAAHKFVAKLWKNGIEQSLTDGTYAAWAQSICVSDGDVYVAFLEQNAQKHFNAKFWKNGVVQNLTDGSRYSAANSVYVFGSDVYVVGYENKGKPNGYGGLNAVAVLWKNGVAQNLTDGNYEAHAYCVFVK